MKKSTKIAVVITIAIILIAGAAGGTIYFMGRSGGNASNTAEPEKADPLEAEEDYKKMQEKIVTENEDPYKRKINFEELQAMNSDVYAWIQIPNTKIDYPILQSVTEADDYYLNTTIDGKQGYPGSIYTEKYNSTAFTDPVTIVYGHDMQEGSMFTDLHKYADAAFFESNPYIYIYLPDATLKYQVFAAVSYDDRYILGSYNFRDKEDFQKYLDELRSSIDGNVNNNIEVTQDSRILTLSTCIADSPNQRWLVNATLVGYEQ